MHTLIALLAATAACALARPPGPTAASNLISAHVGPHKERAVREYFGEYLLPRYLMPNYMGYDESPRVPPPPAIPENNWLNKEIDRINQMDEEDDSLNSYEDDMARWIAQDQYLQRMLENSIYGREPHAYVSEPVKTRLQDIRLPSRALIASDPDTIEFHKPQHTTKRRPSEFSETSSRDTDHRKMFALTPRDKGYYDIEPKGINQPDVPMNVMSEMIEPKAAMIMEPPRQIRQNPNLSRTKTLVAENLDKLRTGLSHEDGEGTDRPRHIHVLDTASTDPAESIYGVALIAAIGAALTIAIFGFAFGWYTLSKKAKAAADVDYPAYGVTGPTIDTSGDRKLAHSAHMYHYQHQKQQIIAMERNGLEQRNGSISDPESEEENEEGDYTVYECPGFATTGDMEVKNPLFSDDPTPATPGKCEVVKPQPKD